MSNAKYYTWDKEDLILRLYIQPNAKQDKVVGVYNDCLKIQITAPAIENKANIYIRQFLAKIFHVSLSSVLLQKGQHSRQKTFRVKTPKQLPVWIASPIV